MRFTKTSVQARHEDDLQEGRGGRVESGEKFPPFHQTLTHTITLRQEDSLFTSLIMQEVVLMVVKMMSSCFF